MSLINFTTTNKISLMLFLFAKACGILGIGLGFIREFRTYGGILLLVDGLLLLTIILLSIFQPVPEYENPNIMNDNLIKEYLRKNRLKAVPIE